MVFDMWEDIRLDNRSFGEEVLVAMAASPFAAAVGDFAFSAVETSVSRDWQGDAFRDLLGGSMLERGYADWTGQEEDPLAVSAYSPWLADELGGDRFMFIAGSSDSAGDESLGGTTTMSTPQEIVVTGKRNAAGTFDWYVNGVSGSGGPPLPSGDDTIEPGGEPLPVSSDEDVVEITIKINRPLGVSEETAIENLKATIAAIETAIRNLADNAILRLANGATVTGEQMKETWAKTDFIVNDNDVSYGNNSFRGEANMTPGGGLISYNIGNALDTFDGFPGGMNYLVGHELGHLTQWGSPIVYNEMTANDIARALLNGAGLEYYATPGGGGYTEGAPMQFSVPGS